MKIFSGKHGEGDLTPIGKIITVATIIIIFGWTSHCVDTAHKESEARAEERKIRYEKLDKIYVYCKESCFPNVVSRHFTDGSCHCDMTKEVRQSE